MLLVLSADDYSGAIYIAGASNNTAIVYLSTFVRNTATRGGAIYFDADEGSLAVVDGEFRGNHASEKTTL